MPSVIESAIRSTVTKGITAVASFNRGRMADAPNPFLNGINAPVDKEVSLQDLKVTGQIPTELNGRYLRIGPNPLGPVKAASHHWFVGDGMVHGVRLQAGKALWYRNRWVRSTAVSKALGEQRAPGPRHFSDTVNTNVMGHAGKTWALVEAGGYPVELGDELQTIAHNPFEGTLKGSFSAHSHTDLATGDLHAICYEGQDQNTLRHVVVGKDGKVKREEPIAVKHGPSVHDCMVTASYVVVLDLPVTFSMPTLLAGYPFPYKWNPAHQARVGLLKKDAPGSSIVWCNVEPCYVFHPCNGFETPDGKVTLDVVAHPTMFEDSLQGPIAKDSAFERWTIDPVAQTVQRKVLDAQPQEFPRPNETRMGLPYRYAYTVALERAADGDFVAAPHLLKHDLQTGGKQVHDFGKGQFPSEFVFVPRNSGGASGSAGSEMAEDSGWLMGYVVDLAAGTSTLQILDAANFTAAPVATVHIPVRIPSGFHGNWVAAS